MSKQRIAQALTIAVLAVVAVVVIIRRPGGNDQPGELTPRDTIYAMLDAARAGKVDEFVGHYAGEMRATLDQAIAEQGTEGFATHLIESNAAIKGIAVTAPEELSPSAVKARVEYVYQDRNEVQFLYLEREGGTWRITRVDGARWMAAPVPYGTPE